MTAGNGSGVPMLDLQGMLPALTDGDVPRFRQLYQAIRQRILDGQLPADSRLPSSRHLASQLQISRNTVMQAYEQLLAEGYIRGATGAGTFVNSLASDSLQQSSTVQDSKATLPGLSQRGQRLSQLGRSGGNSQLILAPGIPELDTFPWTEWRRLLNQDIRRAPRRLANYGQPQGYLPLRQALADYLRESRGVRCDAAQVVVTSGAQQGIELVARLCLEPGDRVWVEDPGYIGARGGFIAADVQLQPMAVDDEGLIPDAQAAAPRLIYLTPSHQYPTGGTLPLARRLALIDLARQWNCWILEDDYDSEYRYEGRPLAAMQGLDPSGRVLYIGTLAKVMFPSLRLGYLVLPEHLVDSFCRYRSLVDYHAPLHTQAAAARFIASGNLLGHIRKMRQLYAGRRDYLWQRLLPLVGSEQRCRLPEAGMHLCQRLPEADDSALSQYLMTQGVGCRALSAHCLQSPARGLVMGYAGYREDEIDRGVSIVQQALEQRPWQR
ncbi:hypothetical protein C4K68_06305 [Pokkaliibacter plantistimulans]|uniref:HTH gntR-type domain-containing protein n=2 Tax=Pseudomonadota TaxID=1224 RepID=A0A2S5KTQ8_9PROT|nr:hypothetical protein C4K68_06305 [Pokkaliibacter plantistimulans]